MSKTTVLSILGGIGVVATGLLAAHAGACMERDQKRIVINEPETIKEAVPYVWKPVVVGAATLVDIIAIDRINAKTIAGIAAGGLATAEILRRTQDEVKKIVGYDNYNIISKKVATSIAEGVKNIPQIPLAIPAPAPDVKEDPTRTPKKFILALTYSGDEDGDAVELGIPFVSTDYDVLNAEYQLNRLYASSQEASVADFMDMLPKEVSAKIEPINQYCGWDYEYMSDFVEDNWIGFQHVDVVVDDTEYTVICCSECPPVYRPSLEKRWNGE